MTPLMHAVNQNNLQAVKLMLKSNSKGKSGVYKVDIHLKRVCDNCETFGHTAIRFAKLETEQGKLISKALIDHGSMTNDMCDPQYFHLDLEDMTCLPCHEMCVNGCTKANDPFSCVKCRSFKSPQGECVLNRPRCPPGASLQVSEWHVAECRCNLEFQKMTKEHGCIDCEIGCKTCGTRGCEVCQSPYLLNLETGICKEDCPTLDGSTCGNCTLVDQQARQTNAMINIQRMSLDKKQMMKNAIDHQNILALQYMMCHKYPKDNDTFYWGIETCNYKIIFSMVKLNYVNKKYQDENNNGFTPLHLVAEKCFDNEGAKIAEILQDHIHVTKRDNDGFTALMIAAENNNNAVAEILVKLYEEKHINIKTKKHRKTALHIAADNCNRGIFDMLIKKHANQNIRDKYGRTPLEYVQFRCDNFRD